MTITMEEMRAAAGLGSYNQLEDFSREPETGIKPQANILDARVDALIKASAGQITERMTNWAKANPRSVMADRPIEDLVADEVERRTNQARGRTARYLRSVPAIYRECTLGHLDTDQPGDAISRWASSDATRTLFLVGAPGTGKTFAAYAIAAEHVVAHDGPAPVVYSVPGLLDALRPGTRGDHDPEYVWDRVKTTPLLVLDDLATAKPTDWATERMWMLADARTGAGLRTVLTTNSPWAELVQVWGEPTMDRLRDRSVVLKFEGKSRRLPATDW